MIRSIMGIVLIALCAWLYWQNLNLQHEVATLQIEHLADTTKLGHLHQKPAAAKAAPLSPMEDAQVHLEAAKDAAVRHDYATAQYQLDLAGKDADKAAKAASVETRQAGKQLGEQLEALRKQVGGAAPSSRKLPAPAGH